MNDRPDIDETPEAAAAARRAALERLAARSTEPNDLFDRDVLALVDADAWGYQPETTMENQPGNEAAPGAAEDEPCRLLRREAAELAADAADRAEIAELRADLGDPRPDLPT